MEADDPTEGLTYYDQEMDDCVTGYAAYVLEQVEAAQEVCSDPVVLIEQRVDFSRWVEQGFEPPTASLSRTAPCRSSISNMVSAYWSLLKKTRR